MMLYLGAAAMADALAQGADVVGAGRVADPALAIAPILHHFGWACDDWDRLAVAACCGHLLECGSQLTGGVYWDPGHKDVPGGIAALATLGYPIAEIGADLSLVVTKPAGTGGVVNAAVVKEQLLYELHDPAAYVTPDVVLDLSRCTVEEVGADRVAVRGLRGHARPEALKVTASFEGAWLGEGEVTLAGPNALARAKATAEVLLERLRVRGLAVTRARADISGLGAVHDSDAGALWRGATSGPDELRVRLAVEARLRDEADQAAREVLEHHPIKRSRLVG